MSNPKVFIGSSKGNIEVARLIADRLESDGCGDVSIWDEGAFSLNRGVLERLLAMIDEFDFAILIWAADDVTESRGESQASPRDNVIFECGLFMGAIGRDRAFMVCDESVKLKIPSDLAGVTLTYYDGTRVKTDGLSAVRAACDEIATEIRKRPFQEFVGGWRSRYAKGADLGHAEVIDDVEIESSRGGIIIKSMPTPGAEPYSARGRLYENQIMGEWRHAAGASFAEGSFMLVVNPLVNVMYGYCTGRDENGAMIFETWVLVKKTGLTESKITERLLWGEMALRGRTMILPPPEIGQ